MGTGRWNWRCRKIVFCCSYCAQTPIPYLREAVGFARLRAKSALCQTLGPRLRERRVCSLTWLQTSEDTFGLIQTAADYHPTEITVNGKSYHKYIYIYTYIKKF